MAVNNTQVRPAQAVNNPLVGQVQAPVGQARREGNTAAYFLTAATIGSALIVSTLSFTQATGCSVLSSNLTDDQPICKDLAEIVLSSAMAGMMLGSLSSRFSSCFTSNQTANRIVGFIVTIFCSYDCAQNIFKYKLYFSV